MDELVHHCLRELSFDGDLGCDVSRLQDFIEGYYAHRASVRPQNVDEAFCNFVWSLIVQQPSVRVGTVPEGVTTDVYIAPQRKVKSEETAEEVISLDIIPDAALKPLQELKAEYGDRLRIATDPETTFVSITGSHIRPPKLTGMVYSALQLICRGREDGISVVDISKKTGYDPKTSHYLVDKLLELELVVKLKKPGVGSNFCILKHFYEQSEIWKRVKAEEARAEEAETKRVKQEASDEDEEDDEDTIPTNGAIHFDPIDLRHLSSLPLVRGRIVKLLENSPNHIHKAQNLLVKIGFANPRRTDRRFFKTRLQELISQGVIERLQVPRANGKPGRVNCIRLLNPGDTTSSMDVKEADVEIEDIEPNVAVKANVTVHKQIIDLLAASGTEGMTLNELSQALGDMDRRIVELLLSRMETYPPPPHLSDLGIVQFKENVGRERRYRYCTMAHYPEVAKREQLDNPVHALPQAGDFMPIDERSFYTDEDALNKYVNDFRDIIEAQSGVKKKSKRIPKNPILPDGTVKKGRPRKEGGKQGKKRKRGEEEDVLAEDQPAHADEVPDEVAAPPRKRGRPRKSKVEGEPVPSSAPGDVPKVPVQNTAPQTAPKKRGRPSKKRPASSTAAQEEAQEPEDPAKVSPNNSAETGQDVSAVQGEALASLDIPTPQASSSEVTDVGHLTHLGKDFHAPADSADSPMLPAEVAGESRTNSQDLSADCDRSNDDPNLAPVPQLLTQGSTSENIDNDNRPGPEPVAVAHNEPVIGSSFSSPFDSNLQVNATHEVPGPEDTASSGDRSIFVGAFSGQEHYSGEKNFPGDNSILPMKLFHESSSAEIPIDPALVAEDMKRHQLQGDERNIPASPLSSLTPVSDDGSLPATQPSSNKRAEPDTPVSQHTAKRAKTDRSQTSHRAKANITQSRREKELLRVITEGGGIISINSKELYDAHAALIERLTKAGEVTSTLPGSRLDRRTVDATIAGLEAKGKVKTMSTILTMANASTRPFRIAYLPEKTDEAVSSFLADVSRSVQVPSAPAIKTVDEPILYGGAKAAKSTVVKRMPTPKAEPPLAAPALHLVRDADRGRNAGQVEELFRRDDATIRASLLTERSTLAQLYGYVAGKAASARELHLLTLKAFDGSSESVNVVSAERRIIHFSHYLQELPVSAFCAVVSCHTYDENLMQLLETSQGSSTAVSSLPPGLQETLGLRKKRVRDRIYDLLDILRCLGLVVPLQVSQSDQPAIRCLSHGSHPAAFDEYAFSEPSSTAAPQFWQFKKHAPVYLWLLSERDPPYWQDFSVESMADGVVYWKELECVSTDSDYARSIVPGASSSTQHPAGFPGRWLHRATAWSTAYKFSWFQAEYLKSFIEISTGRTPLQDEDGGQARLQHIAWVVCAPQDAVRAYFVQEHAKSAHEIKKAQARKEQARDTAEQEAKRSAREKHILAARAAEAKQQRERDWDEMVLRVHPEPLKGSIAIRVRRVRSRFLQSSGTDHGKWEAEIAKAIEEAKMTAKTVVSSTKPAAGALVHPPSVLPTHTEKSIEELIAQQGSPLPAPQPKLKKRKKAQESETVEAYPKEIRRRRRFDWNKDYDELARDASAVIKARCRDGKRIEWAPLEQIFPAVPRNTVRQRIGHLRMQPGGETYFKRLEDRWYELWMQHRGTPVLPDEDPESGSNFDIVAHIAFLRNNIDKNALRVGFAETPETFTISLPSSVSEIQDSWDIIEKVPMAPPWDFMWNVAAEEGREKQLSQHAFASDLYDTPAVRLYPTESAHVADAAWKMTLGTPADRYDPAAASALLLDIGEEPAHMAKQDLLDRGVLSKVVRDPATSKPGRTLKISEVNQNAIGGSMSREVFQDGTALEELVSQQEEDSWREWSLLATDGDTAALTELVSENKIQFKVDTTHVQAARARLDWNSKKGDDDDFETTIYLRLSEAQNELRSPSIPASDHLALAVVEPGLDETESDSHGITASGEMACCRRHVSGPVDCQACLDVEYSSLLQKHEGQEAGVIRDILTALRDAGSKGLTKERLFAQFPPSSLVSNAVRHLTESAVPLAFWTGYSHVVLVSSAYLKSWTVVISETEDALARSHPRRWLDITGHKMNDVWAAALRAVIGVILFRPGVSQTDIRWRLRSVYDRQEINDVLRHLEGSGYIKKRVTGDLVSPGGSPPDDQEERSTFWTIADRRHWYQV